MGVVIWFQVHIEMHCAIVSNWYTRNLHMCPTPVRVLVSRHVAVCTAGRALAVQ